MRKKKELTQTVKRIYRPEVSHCLDCGTRLRRVMTITERTVITLSQVIKVVHCGYRCPVVDCPGHKHLYRSREADALALPGFTFGLDIVLLVGQLRLREHHTVDEIHRTLTQQLERIGQSISRREMLYLFEAYTALLRAGTEVHQDEEWKEQVRKNGGLLLSLDGIQPDKGNETIYLVRDVFTGRIINAENTTESTTHRLKEVLAPAVALHLPVLGTISDAQPTELRALAELWPDVPHQICQFHAIREAGRLIYNADHRVKTDLRIRMQEKTHELRQKLQKELQEVEKQENKNEQEYDQLKILEEYTAMVEGAVNLEGMTPFHYAGVEMGEALTSIQTSLDKLKKGGAP